MEHEDSIFLFGMPSSSSPIPPTTVAQPQNSHSIEMSEIPLDQNHPTNISPRVRKNCCKKFINLNYIFYLIISFLAGFTAKFIPNGYNLVAFPSILTSLFVCSEIFRERYKGKGVQLKLLVLPIAVPPLMVLLGTIISPVTLLLFPCLLVLFLVARLLQFIRHGEAYDNVTLLKFCIRTWMYILYLYSIASVIAVILAVWHAPSLKYKPIFGLTYLHWELISWKITGMLMFGITFSTCVFFYIPRVQIDPLGSGINVPEAVLEIADCGNALVCLNQKLPYIPHAYKNWKMYGVQISTWVNVLLIIVISNNIIGLSIHAIVLLFKKKFHDNLQTDKKKDNTNAKPETYSILENFLRNRYLMYWVNGLKHYATFLLSSLLFLLVWVLFFGHKLNGTPKAKQFLVFGTRTCLSFMTCAFLWFIKSCILLSWEAESIYDRLESRILQGGKHLYFLGILGRHKYDMFKLLYDNHLPKRNHNFWNNFLMIQFNNPIFSSMGRHKYDMFKLLV